MRISRAPGRVRRRRWTKISLAGVAGVAAAVAVLAGTAQAAPNRVYVIDSHAAYPHAVAIYVDGQFRRCSVLNPKADVEFGPKTTGSSVRLDEYPGTSCYDGSTPLKVVNLSNVKPQQHIDLATY